MEVELSLLLMVFNERVQGKVFLNSYKPDKRIQLFVIRRVRDPEKKNDMRKSNSQGIYVLSTPKRRCLG